MSENHTGAPGNWDEIQDRATEENLPPDRPLFEIENHDPAPITLMAAAWADLAGILAVCAGALLALVVLGEQPALPAFPWAAGMAVVWWGFAATVLVVIRQGTPGMLLAGIVFETQIHKHRVPGVLLVAVFQAATLGCLGMLGARKSLLGSAAGVCLVHSSSEGWQD